MERHSRSLWLLMGILLLLRHAAAQNKTDVPVHVNNRSEFWGWISAEECLQKYQKTSSGICNGTAILTHAGKIEVVNTGDLLNYCQNGGCLDHTTAVLDCIHHVKRDYHFYNKADVSWVNHTITNACNNLSGINTTSYTGNNAMKLFASCSLWNMFLSILAFIFLIKDIHLMI